MIRTEGGNADDLQRLVERIEDRMVSHANNALAPAPWDRSDGRRKAAAEWAVIALALRARITQENPK